MASSSATSSGSNESDAADALTLVDRFLSASSGPDAHAALETLVQGLEQERLAVADIILVSSSNAKALAADSILLLETLLQVLTLSQVNGLAVDQGPTLVARFYTAAVKQKATSSEMLRRLVQEPNARLVDALISVAVNGGTSDDNNNTTVSDYARVLCLELVHSLAQHATTSRLLMTLLVGNGTTLLAQLLAGDSDSTPSPVIHQEAMRLALLLSTWPAVAKNWIFMSVPDQVLMQLTQQSPEDSHLTDGPAALCEWLQLLHNLLQHSDASLVPLLVLESQVVLPKLTELLDLRMGRMFRFPNTSEPVSVASTSRTISKSTTSDEDDLDDLLQAGSSVAQVTATQQSSTAAISTKPAMATPSLTDSEEKVVSAVLDVLASMLEHDSVRQAIVSSNNRKYDALVTFLWELGLLIRPDVSTLASDDVSPFACAVPSLALQQQALQVLAQYCCTPPTDGMTDVSHAQRLDRLLYLVCTGGSSASSADILRDQLALSQSALACFRNLQSPEQRTELLLYSLAPPPPPIYDNEDDETAADAAGPDTSIVARLLNTVLEQIVVVMTAATANDTNDVLSDRCQVLLSGATSALMVLLTDEASRSMLLRLTEEPSLVDQILECLAALGKNVQSDKESDVSFQFCAVVLLRFLVHWISESPQVIHRMLQSPSSSLAISAMFASPRDEPLTLTTLLLGLVMNDMGRKDNNDMSDGDANAQVDESLCGGWTRASIMEMMTSHGISRVTSRLEAFKNRNELLPWSLCSLEWNVWKEWYNERVLLVRKRMIHELTGSTDPENTSDDDDAQALQLPTSDTSSKALRKVVSRQTNEMELLQQQLSELRHTVAFQERQMAEWKKRLDSNPTQLDEMMDDYSAKVSELARQNELLKEDLHLKDTTIKTVQQQLEETRVQYDESRQESDSLRDELTALSHAYSSLETEYQQQKSQRRDEALASAQGSTFGERGDSPRQSSHSDGSQQTPASPVASSNEVAMLRADNARLRQDAQAADEWMAMAVEKLNELGGQNATLIEQVASLQQQIETTSSDDQAALRAEMDAARHEMEATYLQRMAELEQQLLKENARHCELEAAALEAHRLSQELDAEQSRVRDLQEQVRRLELDPQIVQPVTDRSQNIDRLEKELQDAKDETKRLLDQIASHSASSVGDTKSWPSDEPLASELEHLRGEFAAAMTKDQEELYRCEARIRELEARLDGGLGKYTMEDIHQRDCDIAELQKANNEAQEWMANAMEQHQLLSNQVATLAQENNALMVRVRELLDETGGGMDTSDKLGDLEMLRLEVNALRRDLASRDETIQQLRVVGPDESTGAEKDRLGELESQVLSLNQKLEEQEKAAIDVIKQWSDSYAALEEDRHRLQARLDASSDQDSDPAAIAAIKGWEESYRALETSRDELRARLERLENDKSGHESAPTTSIDSKSFEAQLLELNERLARQEADAMATITGWQESYEALEVSRNDVVAQLEALVQRKEENEQSGPSSSDAQVGELSLQLEIQKEESIATISAWQERFAELEAATNDLKTQLGNAHNRLAGLETLEKELLEARNAMDELRSETVHHEKYVDELRSMLATTEASKEALTRERTEDKEAIARLEESLNELRDHISEKTTQIGALEVERDALRSLVNDLKRAPDVDATVLEELQGRIELLLDEKHLLEEELARASDVVSQWEKSYAAMEAAKADLETALNTKSLETPTRTTPVEDEADESASLKIEELEAKIRYLEEQQAQEENEAQEAISQWQEAYQELEAKHTMLQSQISAAEAEKKANQSTLAVESESESAIQSGEAWLAAIDKLRHQIEQLEAEKETLASEMATASDAITRWETNYNALETEKRELESRLSVLDAVRSSDASAPADENGAGHALVVTPTLEARVKELEVELRREESEAQAAISEWQAGYSTLEKEKNELQEQLEMKVNELDRLRNIHDESQARAELQARLEQLETDKLDLEAELSTASDVVAQWEASYKALEIERFEIESRAAVGKELDVSAVATDEASIASLALEKRVKEVQDELLREGEEAQAAILEWQEGYNAIEKEKDELKTQLDSLAQSHDALTSKLASSEMQILELQSTLADLEDEKDRLLVAKSKDDGTIERIESELDELRLRYSEKEVLFEALQAEHDNMIDRLTKAEQELEVATTTNNSGVELDDLRGLVARLQAANDALESDIVSASDVVAQWESSYNQIESEKADLESRFQELLASKAEADQLEVEAQEAIAEWENRCNDYEAEMTGLRSRLESLDQANEASENKIQELNVLCDNLRKELESKPSACEQCASYVESIKGLESKLSETESLLSEARNVADQRESDRQSALSELIERTTEVEDLSRSLADADQRVQQLQKEIADVRDDERVLGLEKRIRKLENDHRVVHAELQDKRQSCDELSLLLQAAEGVAKSLREENSRLREREESIAIEKAALEGYAEEIRKLNDELAESTDIIVTMEAERSSMAAELDAYRLEAEATIEQWKATLNETQSALETAKSNLNDAHEELVTTANNADLAIDEWESRCRELESRISSLTTQLETTHASSLADAEASSLVGAQEELDRYKIENATLLAEKERLVGLLHERENDLKEAVNAVEFQITNTVSERAAALASEALRKHVDELRSSLQVTQQDYLEMQEARLAAEDEVELLREDLAALLGMKNTPETQSEVRRQAIQLKEEFRRKERAELVGLKDALANALDRLEAAHEEHSAAEERISKISLQASIYEQELVSAKSDLNLLTEKLDEMRQAESSQRESMEYRITELQNEHDVLQKQNTSRLRALQNELSQVTMERDRLMKALKESERNKDSFFQSTLGREPSGSPSDLQAELNKLRLEKAHLLNSVSEEAATVERRIREARAASKSIAEAEVIVERELRLSTEQSLKELQTELEGLKAKANGNESDQSNDHEHLESLRHEIQALHEQNMSLAQELTCVEEELHTYQETARDEKKKLTEDLRKAMTRNTQLEREGRQEAEFYTEMARLRNRDYGSPSKRQDNNPADDFDSHESKLGDGSQSVRQCYDETKKLTERMAQDRSVYLKLVEEHDELLAVLAKKSMFLQTVQSALLRVGGKEAIEQAVTEANQRALEELGVAVEFGEEKAD